MKIKDIKELSEWLGFSLSDEDCEVIKQHYFEFRDDEAFNNYFEHEIVEALIYDFVEDQR